MSGKNYWALAFIAFFFTYFSLALGTGLAQETGSYAVAEVVWGEPGQPVEVGPGSLNVPLSIKIIYMREEALSYASLLLVLPKGLTGLDGSNYVQAYISSLQRGQAATVTFRVNVAEDVKLGVYDASLRFTGYLADGTVFSTSSAVKLPIKGEVRLVMERVETRLVAGMSNSISVVLKNGGSGAAKNVQLRVTAPSQVSLFKQTYEFGEIGSGESVSIPLSLYIAPSLGGLPLTLSFSVSYLDAYLNSRMQSFELGYVVGLPGTPNMIVGATSNTLTMLQVNSLGLVVSNVGTSPIRDLTLTLSVSPPLILIGSDGRFHVDSIAAGETVNIPVSFYVSETTAPSVQAVTSLTYVDESNQIRSESRTLMFFVSAVSKELLSPIVIRLSPTLLYSGTINNVTVYLQNTGTTTLKAITVETPQTTSQATWIQDSPLTLESLRPGEEHEFKTRLYITQGAPTSLPLTLRVTYFMQDNVPKQEERQIGVLVKGLVKFEVVDYSVLPERPSPGQVFSITAVVVNVGTSTAMSVSIRPGEVQGFRPFGQTRTFLGDVAVNTPSSVTISMTVLNTTRPGPIQIPLVITYRNQLGESFTESLTIPVVVGQPAQGGLRGGAVQTTAAQQPAFLQTSGWTGLMVAGALAAGLVVGLVLGRRKR